MLRVFLFSYLMRQKIKEGGFFLLSVVSWGTLPKWAYFLLFCFLLRQGYLRVPFIKYLIVEGWAVFAFNLWQGYTLVRRYCFPPIKKVYNRLKRIVKFLIAFLCFILLLGVGFPFFLFIDSLSISFFFGQFLGILSLAVSSFLYRKELTAKDNGEIKLYERSRWLSERYKTLNRVLTSYDKREYLRENIGLIMPWSEVAFRYPDWYFNVDHSIDRLLENRYRNWSIAVIKGKPYKRTPLVLYTPRRRWSYRLVPSRLSKRKLGKPFKRIPRREIELMAFVKRAKNYFWFYLIFLNFWGIFFGLIYSDSIFL